MWSHMWLVKALLAIAVPDWFSQYRDSRQNYGISPGMWDFPFAGTVSFYVEYVGLFCL